MDSCCGIIAEAVYSCRLSESEACSDLVSISQGQDTQCQTIKSSIRYCGVSKKMVFSFQQMVWFRECWHEEVLRQLRQGLTKCYQVAFETRGDGM